MYKWRVWTMGLWGRSEWQVHVEETSWSLSRASSYRLLECVRANKKGRRLLFLEVRSIVKQYTIFPCDLTIETHHAAISCMTDGRSVRR